MQLLRPTRSKDERCMASGCQLQPTAVVLTKALEGSEATCHAWMQHHHARPLWECFACTQLGGAALQAPHSSILESTCHVDAAVLQEHMIADSHGNMHAQNPAVTHLQRPLHPQPSCGGKAARGFATGPGRGLMREDNEVPFSTYQAWQSKALAFSRYSGEGSWHTEQRKMQEERLRMHAGR